MSSQELDRATLRERARQLAHAAKDVELIDASDMLVFEVGAERYAVPLSSVDEVAEITTLAVFPGLPPAVRGLVNCRGLLCCAVDLRLLNKSATRGVTDLKHVVFVSEAGTRLGLLATSLVIGQFRAGDFLAGSGGAPYVTGISASLVALVDVRRLLADARFGSGGGAGV